MPPASPRSPGRGGIRSGGATAAPAEPAFKFPEAMTIDKLVAKCLEIEQTVTKSSFSTQSNVDTCSAAR